MVVIPHFSRARLAAGCLTAALWCFLLMPMARTVQGAAETAASSVGSSAKTSKKTTPSRRTVHKKAARSTAAHRRTTRRRTRRRRYSRNERIARTRRIRQAFVASTELRPMAQQLVTMRTPAAFAGVAEYARRHTGSAAAAAYLALGNAYLLDHRYREAETSFRQALAHDGDLADYADYLDAQASHAAGDDAAAEKLLHGFAARYPDSIFVDEAPVLEANVLLAMNNPTGAQKALAQALGTDEAQQPSFELAQAQVALAMGDRQEAQELFKNLLLDHPLSSEAEAARMRLKQMGAESTLTVAELRSLGDAYYRAGRYKAASEQYRALAHDRELSEEQRQGFQVAEAACELGMGRLTRAEAEALPDADNETGARRLYLLMELARDRQDTDGQKSIIAQMEQRFPHSKWLAQGLFSSGNMYLLRRDYPTAVEYYSYLAEHFPENRESPAANWRAGWLSYRLGQYPQAAQLFEQEIRQYPSASEAVSALYWRGRLFETQEHHPAMAATDYQAIVRAHPGYYYAQLARVRLLALQQPAKASDSVPGNVLNLPKPRLIDAFPADSPHLAKARLLANAGLSEYVAQEIAADPDWASFSALGEAQIYASYGETFRALRAIKRAIPEAASVPIQSIPLEYLRILYPEPWWDTIKAESAKNNLDPYLVASLIRQESEFNPSVISYANAYGLMQLLPRVGRDMARQEGMRDFKIYQLLDPQTNIRLGTRYLREMLDKFGGVQEYALAAYNAGDNRVVDWRAAGPYSGMDEFVESIPFTQTRNYVESILRNEEAYKAIDAYAREKAAGEEQRAAQ